MNDSKKGKGSVAVFGASGHTGRFVVDELERRGLQMIRIGRDAAKLAAVGRASRHPARVASIDEPSSLDTALAGANAVINCAGPFIDTAIPVIDAALRAGIPYFDVCAEQATVQSIFDMRHDTAVRAGVPVFPAAAFYGGLADLLATAAAGGAGQIDDIAVAVGLDSWFPTTGTRITGQRNTAPRLLWRHGRLEPVPTPAPEGRWEFAQPLGSREVMMLPFSETIMLASHLDADRIASWINVEPIRDIRDAETPGPVPADELGRSNQQFILDVVISAAGTRRRATASGRDIYHVTAPIIVEAVQRFLAGEAAGASGVHALGNVFDSRSFLGALEAHGVQIDYSDNPPAVLRREMTDVLA